MKKTLLLLAIIYCCTSRVFCQDGQNFVDTATKVKPFAPGVVSSQYDEWAPSFTPDGKTVYFCRSGVYWTICFSKLVNGKWMKPKVASFSGYWMDTDPFISPDGKRLFFVSDRPLNDDMAGKAREKQLWYVDYISGERWSKPRHLEAPVNLDGVNGYAPSVSRSGSLCFFSPRRDIRQRADYYAKWLGDHYDQPKQLLFTGDGETKDPFIAPDESYILFTSGNDIYISYRKGGDWLPGQKLDKHVNNGDANAAPYVSPDGRMLFWSSNRTDGFYKRQKGHVLNFDELEAELKNIFNGSGNILMVPVNMSKAVR